MSLILAVPSVLHIDLSVHRQTVLATLSQVPVSSDRDEGYASPYQFFAPIMRERSSLELSLLPATSQALVRSIQPQWTLSRSPEQEKKLQDPASEMMYLTEARNRPLDYSPPPHFTYEAEPSSLPQCPPILVRGDQAFQPEAASLDRGHSVYNGMDDGADALGSTLFFRYEPDTYANDQEYRLSLEPMYLDNTSHGLHDSINSPEQMNEGGMTTGNPSSVMEESS